MIKQNTRLYDMMQAITLFGFTLYFVGVVVSGSVYRYVHERQIPMLLFSAAVFCMIGILKLKNAVQKPQRRTSFVTTEDSRAVRNRPNTDARRGAAGTAGVLSLAVFAIALIGMSAVLGAEVSFSQFAYTGSLGESSIASSIVTEPPLAADSSGADAPPAAAGETPFNAADILLAAPKMLSEDGCILMNDDTFTQWLTELYTNPDAWVGKKITATGSVWKDGELFEKDEFALARMMMVCCAADMQPVGILAQWNDVPALTDGEWIEVTGTLLKKPYKDSFDPLIIVQTIKKVDAPQQAYLYP